MNAAVSIEVADLMFAYTSGGFQLQIPRLQVRAGGRTAIVGPSGSGKTTLLHLLAGVLVPAQGCIRMGSVELTRWTDSARRAFRLLNMGLVFQEFELLEHLTVFENLLLPCRLHRAVRPNAERRQRVHQLADVLGLKDKLSRYPRALSQGERQRVAVGRALLLEPSVILADEPTGNLDPATKELVLNLLLQRAHIGRSTVVIATHDYQLLEHFDQVVQMDQLTQWHVAGPTAQSSIKPTQLS
jgi:putative ABC transport system ATP-binding protein